MASLWSMWCLCPAESFCASGTSTDTETQRRKTSGERAERNNKEPRDSTREGMSVNMRKMDHGEDWGKQQHRITQMSSLWTTQPCISSALWPWLSMSTKTCLSAPQLRVFVLLSTSSMEIYTQHSHLEPWYFGPYFLNTSNILLRNMEFVTPLLSTLFLCVCVSGGALFTGRV